MSLEIQPSTPGELSIPHGRLLLPQRLLVSNDRELSVEWDAWQGSRSRGTAGSICMDASLENGMYLRLELRNTATGPVELREAAMQLLIDQPDSITVIPDCGISTSNPWDFNLTHDTLSNGGSRESLPAP